MYRHIVPLLLVLLLAACSRAELLYDNADWLAYRWTAKWFDPAGDQPDRWRTVLDRTLEKHRRELLPDVVALLHRASSEAATGLTGEGLTCLARDADGIYATHAALAAATAVELLADVSAGQAEHFAGVLDEHRQEYRDEFLDPDPQRRFERRVARVAERIAYWMGDLDTLQMRQVESSVRAMPDIATGWLDYRSAQQQQLLAVLREGADPAALRHLLTAWWVAHSERPPALTTAMLAVREQTLALLLALDATLDRSQRRHFVKRLSGLRDDLASAAGLAVSGLSPTQAAACGGSLVQAGRDAPADG